MKQVLPEKILLGLLDENFRFSDPPSLHVNPGPDPDSDQPSWPNMQHLHHLDLGRQTNIVRLDSIFLLRKNNTSC